jgi:hypothetical protein
MLAPEGKIRLLMIEFRLVPAFHAMASIASLPGDLRRELPAMFIFMTSLAAAVFKSEELLAAQRSAFFTQVTQLARRRQVAAGQGEARLAVLGECESRGLEPLHRVARLTRAAIEAAGELPGVLIVMTVGAKLMGDLLFEIAAPVTLLATHRHVPATQREICQIMIEAVARHVLPAAVVVTTDAVLAKAAAVRILMAWDAIGKIQPGEFCECRHLFLADFFRRGLFSMAFYAGHLLVAADQLELRAIV